MATLTDPVDFRPLDASWSSPERSDPVRREEDYYSRSGRTCLCPASSVRMGSSADPVTGIVSPQWRHGKLSLAPLAVRKPLSMPSPAGPRTALRRRCCRALSTPAPANPVCGQRNPLRPPVCPCGSSKLGPPRWVTVPRLVAPCSGRGGSPSLRPLALRVDSRLAATETRHAAPYRQYGLRRLSPAKHYEKPTRFSVLIDGVN